MEFREGSPSTFEGVGSGLVGRLGETLSVAAGFRRTGGEILTASAPMLLAEETKATRPSRRGGG
jgi:hypothetical protein